MTTAKERAGMRIGNIESIPKLPIRKKNKESNALNKIATLLQQLIGKDFNISVNVPEGKEPRVDIATPEVNIPAPVVNVAPANIEVKAAQAPNVTVNVPRQAPPNVNVKAPSVKVYPEIKPVWNKINLHVVRDDRGLINDIVLTRED